MSNSTNSEGRQPIHIDPTTVLAVLTLIGGLLLANHEFRSPRPAARALRTGMSISEEKEDTSILDDPFTPIASIVSSTALDRKWTNAQSDVSVHQTSNTTVSIQLVMVPGGASSEDREARIRARHAVVAGLTELKYAPESPDKIGVFLTPWKSRVERAGNSMSETNLAKLAVPFEWYTQTLVTNNAPTNNCRMLLWLAEEMFDDQPLDRLDEFLKRLNVFGRTTDVSLVGPYSSETLKDMLDEISQTNRNRYDNLTGTTLALALPRAPSSRLLPSLSSTANFTRQDVIDILTRTGPFTNAVDLGVTDATLAEKARSELKLRGVDLDESARDHLVVVTDATTMIGRSLPTIFSELLLQRQINAKRTDSFTDARNPGATNLHVFTFLSGLDGAALVRDPDRISVAAHDYKDSTDGNERADKSTGLSNLGRRANPASGANQMDSLERLARSIAELDADIRLQSEGAIRAVLIGGGDIYDTLLILRALRPILPHAVFLTTELDARFWEPQEWDYTHNLIVVSGYGLQLNQRLQGRTGSFRDSRQTALFAATLYAGHDSALAELITSSSTHPAPSLRVPPRTFEIGRNGPLDVDPIDFKSPGSIHPTRNQVANGILTSKLLWAAILLLCVAMLAFLMSRFIRTITINQFEYLAEPLWLREVDLGGTRGIWHIRNLIASATKSANGLDEPFRELQCRLSEILKEFSLLNSQSDPETENIAQPLQSDSCPMPALSVPHRLRFLPHEITDPDALTGLLRSVRFSEFKKEIELKHALPNNRADQCSFLNRLLATIVERGFEPKIIPNLNDPPNTPRKPRRLDSKYWSAFLNFVLKPQESLSSTTLADHQHSELAWENQWIYARLLIQEMLEEFLLPWNLHYLQAEITLSVANQINLGILKGSLVRSGGAEMLDTDDSNDNRTVNDAKALDRVLKHRKLLDKFLKNSTPGDTRSEIPKTAVDARRASWELFYVRRFRLRTLQVLCGIGILCLIAISFFLAGSMFRENGDLLSGTSVVPSILGLFLEIIVAAVFLVESHLQLSDMALTTSRNYRMPIGELPKSDRSKEWRWWEGVRHFLNRTGLPAVPEHQSPVDANLLWQLYQTKLRFVPRLFRISSFMILYFVATLAFLCYVGSGHIDTPHLHGDYFRHAHLWLSYIAFTVFLGLAFWTVDAALLCCWFIQCLTQGPTNYPTATLKMVRDMRGPLDKRLVADYIDVKLINSITSGIGPMLYFPATVLLIMLLSYNTITYTWPWPASWFVVTGAHFALAVYSVLILQRAARKSRDKSVNALEELLYNARLSASRNGLELRKNANDEARELVEEVRKLKGGAFVGIAGNPAIGATLLPVAGTILMFLLQRWIGR